MQKMIRKFLNGEKMAWSISVPNSGHIAPVWDWVYEIACYQQDISPKKSPYRGMDPWNDN